MSSNRAQRLIYLKQTRREVRALAVYCAVATAFAVGAWHFRFPKLLLLALSAIALYFGVLTLINVWASKRHSKAVATAGDAMRSGVSIESEIDVIEAGDIVRSIDLGEGRREVKFVSLRSQGPAYSACVENLYNSIQGDAGRFLRRFDEFKTRCGKQYPEHADGFRNLEIDHLIVYTSRSQEGCVAWVYFSGELGELWLTKYDQRGFADIVSVE